MQRVLVPYRLEKKVRPYLEALRSVGIDPVAHNVGEPLPQFDLQGLLLTGGTDVDPKLYGENPHAETEPADRARDDREIALLEQALTRDLPVLCICRGMQLLNVQQGGTLIQHIESGTHAAPDVDDAHTLELRPGTKLASILGAELGTVNSRHHQAVGPVAPGLIVAATDPADGIVEALEHPARRFLIGVQWHPEDQMHKLISQNLFRAFAQALSI